jgi:antirestriction protein ArdC
MSSSLPKNFETGNSYQGMNILTLMGQDYKDSRWLTFHQIKKLGGSVKKGSKATPIFFMKPIEKEVENESGEVEIKKSFFMQNYNVFNIEQTDGIDYEPEVSNNTNKLDTPQQFIDSINIPLYRGEPAYSPNDDAIFMPHSHEFDNGDEFYSTYFHELTHSTGHSSRLDRFDKHTVYGDEKYAFEELIAELGSVFLSMENGINPNSKKQASYLNNWITALKERPNILYSAASHASKSTNYLMDIYSIKKDLTALDDIKPIDINLDISKAVEQEVVRSSKQQISPSM